VKRKIVTTQAPAPSGAYSQAIKAGNTVYIAGQIAKHPGKNEMINATVEDEVAQVFNNLSAVAKAAGGSLDHIVKLTVFLTDFSHFQVINQAMSLLFQEPYPARSTFEVSALPAGARVEVEAIMVVD
jgi:reactive intermediate/imine deaminase